MKIELIDDYINGCSINDLCLKYKIGKIKIKSILDENNIELRKKGGQKKHHFLDIDFTVYKNKSLKCVKTGKIFDDVLNKSGCITTHLKNEHNIEMPSLYKRNMIIKTIGKLWYENYFELIDTEIKKKWCCPICEYSTNDVNNLGGFITKHVKKHNYDLLSFSNEYPNSVTVCDDKVNLNNKDSFIKCEICDKPFRSITNTHLEKHNTSIIEYISLYGDKIFSKDFKTECTGYLNDGRVLVTNNFTSKPQTEINDYIQSLGFNTLLNHKKSLNGVEIDIFIPTKMIGFEYNGLFWHSEKMGKNKDYHINKQNLAKENNIKLYHIFSDEWINNQNIVKNRIKHLLGVSIGKIYARKCLIKEITLKEKNQFLNKTHIQGQDKSTYRIGAFHDDFLVGVMTFSGLRKSLGSNSENGTYELVRFCSNNVVGLASKFLKYFIKKYKPNKIISYSDRRWSVNGDDNLYTKIGFNHVGITKPNYWYNLNDDKRLHRFNFRKDILIKKGYDRTKTEKEIMSSLGYLTVWDCGSDKYEFQVDSIN